MAVWAARDEDEDEDAVEDVGPAVAGGSLKCTRRCGLRNGRDESRGDGLCVSVDRRSPFCPEAGPAVVIRIGTREEPPVGCEAEEAEDVTHWDWTDWGARNWPIGVLFVGADVVLEGCPRALSVLGSWRPDLLFKYWP